MSPVEAPVSPASDPSHAARPGITLYLSLAPVALTRIVDCVKPERYDERPEPDRFTLREAVAHLADFEVTILDRIVIAQETPGATVANFDEDARAVEKDYASRDIHHELEVYENRRRETILHLEGLPRETMQKTFVHPQRGEMTIADWVCVVLGHDVYHLEHASRFLR